jgi:hypothetical protein
MSALRAWQNATKAQVFAQLSEISGDKIRRARTKTRFAKTQIRSSERF